MNYKKIYCAILLLQSSLIFSSNHYDHENLYSHHSNSYSILDATKIASNKSQRIEDLESKKFFMIKAGIQTLEHLNKTRHYLNNKLQPVTVKVCIDKDIDASDRWTIIANALIQQEQNQRYNSDIEANFHEPKKQAQKLLTAIAESNIGIAQPILYELYQIAHKKNN